MHFLDTCLVVYYRPDTLVPTYTHTCTCVPSCIRRAHTLSSVPSCILRAHTHVRACLVVYCVHTHLLACSVAECRALSAGGTWRPPFLLPAPSVKECLKGEYSLQPLLSKNANSWKVELAFLSLLLDNERECVLRGKVTRWPPHTLASPPITPPPCHANKYTQHPRLLSQTSFPRGVE